MSPAPGGPAVAPRLVLATHNAHKITELRAILAPVVPGLDPAAVVGARDVGAPEPVEDGLTFAANALLKARALVAATGLPAVADDSGLAVDVLGGAPGIFSARWAGRHGDDAANLALLLAQLADIAPEHRTARFVCAAALVTPDGVEHVEHGYLEGRLTTAPRGTGGFGYDPILVPDHQPAVTSGADGDPGAGSGAGPAAESVAGSGTGPGTAPRTCAELSPAEKNAISHRGQAFRALAPVIARVLAGAPAGDAAPRG